MAHRRMLLAILLIGSQTASGQEKRFSGPQPGERITSFKVVQVSGPEKVARVDIAGKKDGATVVVFMHKLSEPAIGLMMSLEWFAAKQKNLDHHYVMLTEDSAKSERLARRWWRNPFFSKSPMSISVDGLEGPGKWGLNRKVDMTVVIAKQGKVTHNFTILGPNNTDAPKLLNAIATAVGRKPPSYDKIRKELVAERNRKRRERQKSNPVYKLAPNPELGLVMVRMVNREGANAEYAIRSAKQMKEWAKGDAKKQAALVKYCQAVLKGKFRLSEPVRKQLAKLAESRE